MHDLFRDFAKDLFGFIAPEVPETIPLRILGLDGSSIPARDVIMSAFRRRVIERHPDLQHAYDHPEIQQAAEDALGDKPEIRELVWARDVLMERAPAPRPEGVTGKSGVAIHRFYPSQPRKCRKCGRELIKECYAVEFGPRGRWCLRCVIDDDRARAADRRRRRRANKHCAAPGCTAIFTPSRADGRYCSPRCRQAAYRGRVTAKHRDTVIHRVAVTVEPTEGRP